MRVSIAVGRLFPAVLLVCAACVPETSTSRSRPVPVDGNAGEFQTADSMETLRDLPLTEHQLAQAVLLEINLARTDPQGYAEIVNQWVPGYDGPYLSLPGGRQMITVEGEAAAREAVEYLRSAPALPPLHLSEGMSLGARDHVRDQSASGAVGHVGRDTGQVWDRVSRYGAWVGSVGENISYGFEDPREAVISLLVDDDVPDRGHRRNFFDPDYRVLGVAFGPHPQYGTMCVLTFASRYREGAGAASPP